MDSIAIAFVMALLFRGFVAEVFIIPTGSMAPTLLGRNKDVVCPCCQHSYCVGASEEIEHGGNRLEHRIQSAICPNCRYEADVKNLNVFNGDRILVNKFPYEIGKPKRWDVSVFKYPESPQTNYIKRLVGLPGEAIRVAQGDVFARTEDNGEFRILRKESPNQQRELQLLVYDDRRPPTLLLNAGFPERWNSMTRPPGESRWVLGENTWEIDRKNRVYQTKESSEVSWLRYQHTVPRQSDWEKLRRDERFGQVPPRIITDFCGFNAVSGVRDDPLSRVAFWVGDLTFNAIVKLEAVTAGSELIFELNEGVRAYRCRIRPATGEAILSHTDDLSQEPGAEVELAKGVTALKGTGEWRVVFANVDDRLCLWIEPTAGFVSHYQPELIAEYKAPVLKSPQKADLAPVGVAASNVAVSLKDLLLLRDIYYTSDGVDNEAFDEMQPPSREIDSGGLLADYESEPEMWGELYRSRHRAAQFAQLGPEEYFMMGDNSPRSMDSRLWPNSRMAVNRHAVPLSSFVGKAYFVYWPHGIPFLNGGKGFPVMYHKVAKDHFNRDRVENYPLYTVPFYPQWWRMKAIR